MVPAKATGEERNNRMIVVAVIFLFPMVLFCICFLLEVNLSGEQIGRAVILHPRSRYFALGQWIAR
jgi:hypothetical protein